MKFGSVDNPGEIDFTLPGDHPDTTRVLKAQGGGKDFHISVGCAKWNRQDLKGFYPRGTKDELTYYSTQLRSEEHTSELQSLMRISYAVFCLKKTKKIKTN